MILGIYNPNGGCGKTTTAVNVATELARRGRSVLLVDLQPDMGASISVGVRHGDNHPSVFELLINERRPSDALRKIPGIPNLQLVPGSSSLAGIDAALRNARQPERRLADCIRPLAATVDDVVIPIRADYLSLESLAHFLRWYRDRGAGRTGIARICGILLTMVDYRHEATREIVDIIRVHNRRGVFRTEIPQDPRVSEAPSHGIPLMLYARSRAVRAYERLTTELLERVERRNKLIRGR
jgi:chromosome partitioning protein